MWLPVVLDFRCRTRMDVWLGRGRAGHVRFARRTEIPLAECDQCRAVPAGRGFFGGSGPRGVTTASNSLLRRFSPLNNNRQ